MGKVKVKFYGVLTEVTHEKEVEVEALTIKNLLDTLTAKYGNSFKEKIYNEECTTIRRFINIYVNGRDIRFINHINTALRNGDEVVIIPAVSGGSGNSSEEVELTKMKNLKSAEYMDLRGTATLHQNTKHRDNKPPSGYR